jgi:pyruvate-ferredoxin/flavodoxin oxidoreductase
LDGNEAAASVAYRLSEVIAIYPITPSSTMGELSDEWATADRTNVWGDTPSVIEMQSEGGAIGAVHGALQAGALATTFTASQGLLLMIPNMYKIAGEQTGMCMHVAARTVATHALSIFGDHSDVMACRQTGFALLASNSVQQAHDLACIGHAAALSSRVPCIHFFDGFRTSHELNDIRVLSDDDLRHMIDPGAVAGHRERALTPDRPVLRGTAQNPDVFFQAREACNSVYANCPQIMQQTMSRFARRTGRSYQLFEYYGHPEAERVIVLMGSAVQTARQTARILTDRGERVGVVAVRLYRPFSSADFSAALPSSVRAIAVLDRTKEPGSVGEPLYLDVVAALHHELRQDLQVCRGRYGLSGKEVTPHMMTAVFSELSVSRPKPEFTLGIMDDVTHLSLDTDERIEVEHPGAKQAVFFGLGSDGTVGANKNSIKIIGEHTDQHAQGYFVYDSKKSGATTVSHLRIGPDMIDAPYLIEQADFVACSQSMLMDKLDVLERAAPQATFLLNSPADLERAFDLLSREVQEQIIHKRLSFHVIDASRVAREHGLPGRTNTVMQACFFALSDILPTPIAIEHIKEAIRKTYARKGQEVVDRNCATVDAALHNLHRVEVPATATASRSRPPAIAAEAPDFVQRVTAVMLAGHGDDLPVSAFPIDGTWPVGTARWEKRGIAEAVPVWDPGVCIQCNKCAIVCPHAAIRAKVYDADALTGCPAGFLSNEYKGKEFAGMKYTIQVAPEDCTGCKLCVNVCPAKDKAQPRHKAINMTPLPDVLEREARSYDFFLNIPEVDRAAIVRLDVKGSQFLEPLFEYSGACAGCGETPYVKLLTQLFGDRALIANATGCSSIYGGNLPTTPFTTDGCGRGPTWSNSLFEDNAEFGLGMRLAIDAHASAARHLLDSMRHELGQERIHALLNDIETDEVGVTSQRKRVAELKAYLSTLSCTNAERLMAVADYLVHKSVWLVGGDGWAFDIGYGGLDHVLSTGENVNVLVLDTEVYSNTGGQASKATPLGAAAKFASQGKSTDKKDLGLMAMQYGHVYVASVALGAKDAHTVQVFREAESYNGPSLIIAYSHCIAHGYDMQFGLDQQKRAVASGVWPLYRYDPRRERVGEAPLVVEKAGSRIPVSEYMRNEARFRMVQRINGERFKALARAAQSAAERRVATYEYLSHLRAPGASGDAHREERPASTAVPRSPEDGS